jgi:probable phosphoglycerate mutase
MTARLIIWRHGNTEWNATDRVQGQTDVPLSELGRQQATAAASRLAELKPDHIVTSDLRRAADTAAALAALTDLPVRTDARLRERHYGQWQGLNLTEIAERYPDEYLRWRSGHEVGACGVESNGDVVKRARAALEDAAALGGTVVVASHGGTAKLGIAELLGWSVDVWRTLEGLHNCHWAVLRYDDRRGGWRLHSYNVV